MTDAQQTLIRPKLTLITGGARSGKSSHAERLAAEWSEDVLYVATAQAWDDDMRSRITKHQSDRPDHWHTLEAPLGVGPAIEQLASVPPTIILDCMTLLTSNVILQLPDPWTEAQARANAEVSALLEQVRAQDSRFIIVTNEVGLGIVPDNRLARIYRDVLGRVNQTLAHHADQVIFMVSGLPLRVK